MKFYKEDWKNFAIKTTLSMIYRGVAKPNLELKHVIKMSQRRAFLTSQRPWCLTSQRSEIMVSDQSGTMISD